MIKLLTLIKNNPLRVILSLALAASIWDSYHWRGVAYQQRDTMADLNAVITEQNVAAQQISSECTAKLAQKASRAVMEIKPVEKPAKSAEEFNEWLIDLL